MTLQQDRTLQEFLKSEFQKAQEEQRTPELGRYYASSLFDIAQGKINAENYFLPRVFPSQILELLALGRMYHSFLQEILVKHPHITAIEERIEVPYNDWLITGRIDAVINDNPIELKTCTHLPEKPEKSHIYQLQAYTHAKKSAFGYLSYVQKSPKEFPTRTFRIEYDEAIMRDIFSKTDILHKSLIKTHV